VSGGFLVLRRDGASWALARHEVRGLSRRAGSFAVEVAAGTLLADEVQVVADLTLHPAGAALRRYWRGSAAGLAVHQLAPLVVIDAQTPPPALLSELAADAAANEPHDGADGPHDRHKEEGQGHG
jgi:hypothetical protein